MNITAPAKINLGLAITAKRRDGYHELHSIMAKLDIGDELSFDKRPEGIALTVYGADLPTDSGNLVYRAAAAYLGHPISQGDSDGNDNSDEFRPVSGPRPGVDIILHKYLPLAAGLGGGSSDAATTLLALSRLLMLAGDPATQHARLFGLAQSLGADVPFFLTPGAALAQGIGERLTPLGLPKLAVVLVNPGIHVASGVAYSDVRGRFGPELDVRSILAALETNKPPPYRNDLETPVFERHPGVYAAKQTVASSDLFGVLMSGSGSTIFGLAKNHDWAMGIAQELQQSHPGWWVRATTTQQF
jgi:4-diphosphocytidyl-2-C-methyl-D-erythritol kinase